MSCFGIEGLYCPLLGSGRTGLYTDHKLHPTNEEICEVSEFNTESLSNCPPYSGLGKRAKRTQHIVSWIKQIRYRVTLAFSLLVSDYFVNNPFVSVSNTELFQKLSRKRPLLRYTTATLFIKFMARNLTYSLVSDHSAIITYDCKKAFSQLSQKFSF